MIPDQGTVRSCKLRAQPKKEKEKQLKCQLFWKSYLPSHSTNQVQPSLLHMFHPEFVCPNAGVCIPWKQRFRVPFYWVRELAVEWMSESWVNMMRLLFTRHLQCVTVFHTSSNAGCHWFGNICIQNPWYSDNSTILRADLKNQFLSPSLPSSFPPSPPRYPISLSLSLTHTFSQIRGSRKHPVVLLWDELLRLIDVGLIWSGHYLSVTSIYNQGPVNF